MSSEGQNEPRLLAVDPDPVSLRFIEMALGPSGFEVVSARSGEAALETLRSMLVDLIVSDTDLGDMNGLALLRRLGQQQRLRDLPFVFLSADRKSATKVAALQAGVADFLTKPCDATEFAARCEALVARSRRQRMQSAHRGYSLAGDFTGIGFADLISLLELGRRSGVLSLASSSRSGEIHFAEGRVVHGVCGNLIGPDAFFSFFEEKEAQFEFAPNATLASEEERSITESVMSLLMEAARRFDTARRDSSPELPKVQAPSKESSAGVRPGLALSKGPKPEPRLSRHFELPLRDPFTLGELRLFDARQLSAWTRADVGKDRLHLHVVSDLAEGISAMLPLGGTATERWVLDALSDREKWFGLSFFLRGERTLDLLLLDARDLAPVLPSLVRVPALVVFSPPGGELIGTGTRGRTTLDAYLRRLRPEAMLGVGSSSLAQGLTPLVASASPGTRLRSRGGVLEGAGSSLRDVLLDGLSLWAGTSAEGA